MAQAQRGANRFLVGVAVLTAAFVVGSIVYQYLAGDGDLDDRRYRAGNLRLEDGEYAEAQAEFAQVLAGNANHTASYLGMALALMGQGRLQEALAELNTAVGQKPDFAAAYANRGILHDRLGAHEQALADYREALRLDPELSEGPGWLTRFFRNQYDAPPTIADRARYIVAELQKPPGQRLLTLPELDAKQRSYKVQGN